MLYEVTLESQYFDQQIINRWNYLSSGSPVGVTGSFALLTAMGLIPASGSFPAITVGSRIQELQVSNVIYVSALCKALYDDPTDFYDAGYPSGVIGHGGGISPSSPTMAFGFKTNRVRTDIARGTKRLVGVDESTVGDGGIFSEGTLGAMDNIAAAMSADLSYTDGGSSLTFKPCILGKKKITHTDAPTEYKLYPTLSEQLDHIAVGIVWQSYRAVRTQVSRQYGHGR